MRLKTMHKRRNRRRLKQKTILKNFYYRMKARDRMDIKIVNWKFIPYNFEDSEIDKTTGYIRRPFVPPVEMSIEPDQETIGRMLTLFGFGTFSETNDDGSFNHSLFEKGSEYNEIENADVIGDILDADIVERD